MNNTGKKLYIATYAVIGGRRLKTKQSELVDGRIIYYDVVRIVATLMMIYGHTGDLGRNLYAMTDNVLLRYVYFMIVSIDECCVPLFFMVSGALLLGKEESFKTIWHKRIKRMILVLFVASLLHYLDNYRCGEYGEISILDFFDRLLSNEITGSMWFLYAYILYLFALPFIRKLAHSMKENDYLYMFLLYIVVKGIISIILSLRNLQLEMDVYNSPLFENTLFYPLMGYYISCVHTKKEINAKTTLLWAIMADVIVAYMSMRIGLPREEFTRYDNGLFSSSLTAVIAFGIYFIVKDICERCRTRKWWDNVIHIAGESSFGVYIIEKFVRENIVFVYDMTVPYLTRIGSAFVLVVMTFVVGTIIVYFLRRIPIVRKCI